MAEAESLSMHKRKWAIQISRRRLECFLLFIGAATLCLTSWSYSQIHANISHTSSIKADGISIPNIKSVPLVAKNASTTPLTSNCSSSARSFQDLKNCRNIQLKPKDAHSKESISTWTDAQRCLNHPFYPKSTLPTDRRIVHLVGERSTGTKFVIDEMQQCFKGTGIKIQRDYRRPKHWFQQSNLPADEKNRILVATFRDPVEWVAAMIEKPYHSMHHMKGFDDNYEPIPLPWEDFVYAKQNRGGLATLPFEKPISLQV